MQNFLKHLFNFLILGSVVFYIRSYISSFSVPEELLEFFDIIGLSILITGSNLLMSGFTGPGGIDLNNPEPVINPQPAVNPQPAINPQPVINPRPVGGVIGPDFLTDQLRDSVVNRIPFPSRFRDLNTGTYNVTGGRVVVSRTYYNFVKIMGIIPDDPNNELTAPYTANSTVGKNIGCIMYEIREAGRNSFSRSGCTQSPDTWNYIERYKDTWNLRDRTVVIINDSIINKI